jgi:protein SCO1/2
MPLRALFAPLLAVLTACAVVRPHFAGTALPDRPAPNFTLTDDAGQSWTLAQQHGKTIALFFGYTHCTDTCPATLAKLATAIHQAGGTPQDAEIAFVTVDPQRDTPAVMHRYIQRFSGARIVGLTGTRAQIHRVEGAYHVWAAKYPGRRGGHGYDEAHSSFTYFIDPHGNERVVHDDDDSLSSMRSDLRLLIR